MDALQQIEKAILGLSQVEFHRLVEWLEELGKDRRRVAEPPSVRPAWIGSPMTVAEYLDLESRSCNRHEYLAGEICAMSGASRRHNRIVRRLCEAIGKHLKGGPCEVHFADVQVRLRINRDDYIYYPDVMVVCQRGSTTAGCQRSRNVIVGQKAADVTLFRREEKWQPVRLDSLDGILELRSIGLELPLPEIYGVGSV